ncbi:MAG: glycosyltransferase [Terriglobales bacterium]|jgi:glycosyltransferase involved in cell wall biosynthesis
MPKVSIVVPNYNHARFLRRRIESVLCQTYQDFELILLDDCSTDDSRSILSKYADDPRIRMMFNEKNSGSTFKQWNKGVGMARGEYVWIAESDDYADERLLEKLVVRLDSEPSAVFSYCRSWRVSADGEISGFLDSYLTDLDTQRWTADFWADGREECQNYLVHRNTVPNASAVLFRREVYERVGGADESLVLGGDWKLWAAMALTGRIAYLGEPLNYNRFHDTSVRAESQRLGVYTAEYLEVTRWILQRVTPSEAARRKLCEDVSSLWAPAVLTRHIPLSRRWAILENARAIDRHVLRKLVRLALAALRMTLFRRYHLLRVGSSKSSAEETRSQE